ncbi:MAG: transcriptional regulator, partial [Geodermatophilaceae bacterium]|nr:transcriptional regulator [Geodermatophilaceae bacterium]
MPSETDLVVPAALIGEPARAAMLLALMDGRSRPAGELARAIEALQALAPPLPVRSLRAARTSTALGFARTCYDHLAGEL